MLQTTTDPALESAYVWIAGATLLLALLIAAFAYLAARRHLGKLVSVLQRDALRRADRWLSHQVPDLWRFTRRRFAPRPWHGIALTASLATIAVLIALFAGITEGWLDEEALYYVDLRVYGAFAEGLSAPLVTTMQVITHFGDYEIVFSLGACLTGYLYYRRQRWQIVALVLSTGVGSGLPRLMKIIFGRTRPEGHLTASGGHSFPSGHAFAAAAFYGFVIFIVWQWVRRDVVRIAVTAVFALLIFFVGASRVVLRVHWVTDVLGGFVLGLAWLICSLLIARSLGAAGVPYLSSKRGGRLHPPPGGVTMLLILLVVGLLSHGSAYGQEAEQTDPARTPAEVDSAALARSSWAYQLDHELLLEIHEAPYPAFQEVMRGVHRSAIPIFWSVIPTTWGGAFVTGSGYEAAYRLTLSQLAADQVTILLKRAFGRHRPFVVVPSIETRSAGLTREHVLSEARYRYSFPSGHATTAFAIATSLSLSFPEWYVIAPAVSWASAVAMSRVWLGVHYPSDVVAGAVVGAGMSTAVYLLRDAITPLLIKKGEQEETTLLHVRISL